MAITRGDTNRYIIPLDNGEKFVTVNSKGARCQKPGGAAGPTFLPSHGIGGGSSGNPDNWIGFMLAFPVTLPVFILAAPVMLIVGASTALWNEIMLLFPPSDGYSPMTQVQEPVFCDPNAGKF